MSYLNIFKFYPVFDEFNFLIYLTGIILISLYCVFKVLLSVIILSSSLYYNYYNSYSEGFLERFYISGIEDFLAYITIIEYLLLCNINLIKKT